MKMPSDVQFLEDVRLLIYRPRGLLNEAVINRIVHVLDALEATSKEPFNRFFDTLGHDAVELNFRYVIQVALYRRANYANRPPIKSAILATNATIILYAELHALLTQDSPIRARIFQDREEAARWLGVPLGLLADSSSGSRSKRDD